MRFILQNEDFGYYAEELVRIRIWVFELVRFVLRSKGKGIGDLVVMIMVIFYK